LIDSSDNSFEEKRPPTPAKNEKTTIVASKKKSAAPPEHTTEHSMALPENDDDYDGPSNVYNGECKHMFYDSDEFYDSDSNQMFYDGEYISHHGNLDNSNFYEDMLEQSTASPLFGVKLFDKTILSGEEELYDRKTYDDEVEDGGTDKIYGNKKDAEKL